MTRARGATSGNLPTGYRIDEAKAGGRAAGESIHSWSDGLGILQHLLLGRTKYHSWTNYEDDSCYFS